MGRTRVDDSDVPAPEVGEIPRRGSKNVFAGGEPAGDGGDPSAPPPTVVERIRDSAEDDDLVEAARPAAFREPRADLARVVEKVWVDDIEATYDRLEAALSSGDKLVEAGFVREALDQSAQNLYLANRLANTAAQEVLAWEAENAAYVSDLRERAYASLQKEKDNGQRNKALAEADVVARMQVLDLAKYTKHKSTKDRLEGTKKILEQLAVAWTYRCNSLAKLYKG